MTEATSTEHQVVYVGRRLGRSNKLGYWYLELDNAGELTTHELGMTQVLASVPIGTVLTIHRPTDAPESVYTSGRFAPAISDAWADAEAVTRWRVIDRADAQLVANESRVRRQLKDTDDEFEEALSTLAKHFTPLNYSQRAALLTYVQAKLLR